MNETRGDTGHQMLWNTCAKGSFSEWLKSRNGPTNGETAYFQRCFVRFCPPPEFSTCILFTGLSINCFTIEFIGAEIEVEQIQAERWNREWQGLCKLDGFNSVCNGQVSLHQYWRIGQKRNVTVVSFEKIQWKIEICVKIYTEYTCSHLVSRMMLDDHSSLPLVGRWNIFWYENYQKNNDVVSDPYHRNCQCLRPNNLEQSSTMIKTMGNYRLLSHIKRKQQTWNVWNKKTMTEPT